MSRMSPVHPPSGLTETKHINLKTIKTNMKTITVLALTAVAILSSCQQQTTPEPQVTETVVTPTK